MPLLVSDTIEYDPETGDMSFVFSTVEPSILDGLLSITIVVADRNGNESQKKVALYENGGPWFEFSIVSQDGARNLYLGNETVTLSGIICKFYR